MKRAKKNNLTLKDDYLWRVPSGNKKTNDKQMKRLISFLLLFTFAFSTSAQEVSVKIDTNAILIGAQVNVAIDFKFPKGKQGFFPILADSLGANLEVVERSKIDTILQKEMTNYHQELKVTAFDSGYFVLPAFPFYYKNDGDTAMYMLVSDPHLINVFSVDADTTQPIKPIVGPMKEPYTLMEILPWIIFGAAVLVLIFTMFYFYRKRKKKPIFKSKEEPKIAPNVKALDALAVLRLKKLWQAGKVKAYHTELTEIVRTYIEDRFGIMAVEMTTDEILVEIKPIIANAVAINKLKSSLELADLVKFAKANPTALENDTSLNFAVDFVNESNAQNSVLQEEEVENVE